MRIALYLFFAMLLFQASSAGAFELQAPVRLEMRLVEERPGPGLVAVSDRSGEKSYYVHNEVVVDTTMIKEARVVKGPLNEPRIRILLSDGPRVKFFEFTKAHIGEKVAVLLDGKVASISTVREPIPGGECEFGNDYTGSEAQRITRGINTASSERKTSDPEDAAREYFELLRDSGGEVVVDIIHPEALAKFKEILWPLFAQEAKSGKRLLLTAFFGDNSSLKEVEGMSDMEFARIFIKKAMALRGPLPSFDEFDVIGSVREGDLVHVVARMGTGVGAVKVKKLTVVSFKLDGSEWKPLLSGEIEGMAKALWTMSPPEETAIDASKKADADTLSEFNGSVCEDGGGYDWLSVSDAPVVKLEYRLVLDKKAYGATEVSDPETGGPLYLGGDVIVNNAMVRCARVVRNPVTEKPSVEIQLVKLRAVALEDFTGRNIGRRVAVLLDGKAVMIAKITERISGGRLLISGNFNKEEAERLAAGVVDR